METTGASKTKSLYNALTFLIGTGQEILQLTLAMVIQTSVGNFLHMIGLHQQQSGNRLGAIIMVKLNFKFQTQFPTLNQ